MAGRYQILLICGTGIATSTAIRARVEDALRKNDLFNRVEVRQGKVADILGGSTSANLIVATTAVPSTVSVPVINGVPLLTGIGVQGVLDQIITRVKEGIEG